MSENETPPWSPERGALWRLKRWRDVGDGPVGYTAGNAGFAEDVKVLLTEIEALKAQRDEATQNGAAIMRATCAQIADTEAKPDADDHLIDPEWVKGYGAAARSIARSIRALPVPPTAADRRVTRMTLEEIKALPLNVDWEKIRATTEEDIERMRQEDEGAVTETSTLRSLANAMDCIREAFEITESGLLSDHCQNAMRQIRAAMRIAVGDER